MLEKVYSLGPQVSIVNFCLFEKSFQSSPILVLILGIVYHVYCVCVVIMIGIF